MKIPVNELKEIIVQILDKRGVEDSSVIAEHLIEAELRGHSSHGVQRLIPLVKGIELGTIEKKLNYKILKSTSSSLLIDARRSIGIVLWNKIVNELEFKEPISIVVVRNASHIGFLGYYTRKLAEKGYSAIMFGNAEPAVVFPGKAEKLLSTTPLSISIPSNPPVVLDMALSLTARGKIIEAQRKGEKIPYGVAVNERGEITTDPTEALKGGLLPLGGVKGFYLMLTLELLTSFLTGSAVGPEVKGVLNTENPPNKGEVLIVINPKFTEKDNHGIDLMRRILGSLPGDRGDKLLKSSGNEINIDEKLFNTLNEMAKKIPYF
ncbi:Ldh family oxidoreductase [Acidianus ambivalens]|uniref:Ldh family oxidoreductase n=1 Tax=Acidianus ambivalens TaxID=2283 RepID=A0A650CS08_ACIAM|nr:Ldh family oxidoreductase [Acidianus ambivalens]MQL55030.1 Ldh family oxidoreductase [Acidianus ambivalens]QGR20589.1 Ldh family oxidoreductase [Acidianus ambivalens]